MSDHRTPPRRTSRPGVQRPCARKRLDRAGRSGAGDSPPPTPFRTPTVGRLFRLAVSCPRCGSRPALRVTEEVVRGLARPTGDTRIGTYQCHRRGCGTIYDLYLTRRLVEDEQGGIA